VLLNPYQTRKFHQALRQKATTDSISAFVIADLLRSGRYLSSIVPEEKMESLKELVKMQFKLEEDKKRAKRRLRSLLIVVFPEYEKTVLTNPFGVAAREILKKWPTAKDIASAKTRQIEKIVRSIKGNNMNQKEIENLIEVAKNSLYSGWAKDTKSLSIRILLEQLEVIFSSLSKVKQEIEKILSPQEPGGSFPGENLLSIDGVGKGTLAAFLSIAGKDGEHFPSAKQIIGYVGFYPQIFESGQIKKKNIISHQGPDYIRKALYLASVSSIRHNREMKTLYNKKISQGKTGKQALIYVAKKLTHMMLSMLKTKEEYIPERVFVPPCALRFFKKVVPAS